MFKKGKKRNINIFSEFENPLSDYKNPTLKSTRNGKRGTKKAIIELEELRKRIF